MLKTARMTKLKAIVLDQYLEDVMREFSKKGSVQMIDIKSSGEKLKDVEIASADEDTLNRISELLGRIYYVIDILGITEEKDFFGSLKQEPKKTKWKDGSSEKQLTELEKQFSEIEKSVIKKSDTLVELGEEKARLEPEKNVLAALVRLKVDSKWLGESRFLYFVAGAMKPEDLDRAHSMLEKEKIQFMLKEAYNGEKILVLFVTTKQHKPDLDRILSGVEFQRFSIAKEDTEGSLKQATKRLEEIEKESGKINSELAEYYEKYRDKILAFREVALIEKSIAEANNLMARTKRSYVLEGWVPKSESQQLIKTIDKVTHGCAIVKETKPGKDEVPPTKLENPGILKPFELLIGTFGLPSYKELDPTPILALTFPFLYGLMFGDVGHGLMLVLLGLAVTQIAKRSESTKNLGIIVLSCGLFAAVFGLVYGEAFGVAHGEQQEKLGFSIPLVLTKEIEYHGEVEHVPVYSPLHEPIPFLQLAVMVGSVHILFGLFLSLLNKVFQKKFFEALAGPIPKMWLYGGAVYIFLTYWTNFELWGENMSLIILLIPVPLVLILFTEVIKHLPHVDLKHLPAHLGEGAFEVFDTCLILLSNSISYSRIFALALVHGGLFLALFSIAQPLREIEGLGFFGIIIWLIVIVIGTVLVIALESIIVFLHSLRLHYYEWFTKFYGADGIKYVPFKADRTYTKLEEA